MIFFICRALGAGGMDLGQRLKGSQILIVDLDIREGVSFDKNVDDSLN